MSIADKITELTTIRGDIRTALAGKGVSASDHNFSDFADDITSIPTGSSGWQRPQGWPDLDAYWATLPNTFIGLVATIINYDDDAVFTPTIYSDSGSLVQIGHLDGTNFVAEQEFTVTTGALSFSFTGIKVIKYTSRRTSDCETNLYEKCPTYEIVARSLMRRINGMGVAGPYSVERRIKIENPSSPNHQYYFASLNSVEQIDIEGSFITSSYHSDAFLYCYALRYINGVENMISSSATDIREMFYGCYSLAKLDISGWDISNVTNINSAFKNMYALVEFYPPSVIPISVSFAESKALNKDSLMRILNSLKQLAEGETQTLTLSSASKLLLSDAEKQIATNKGWTIA